MKLYLSAEWIAGRGNSTTAKTWRRSGAAQPTDARADRVLAPCMWTILLRAGGAGSSFRSPYHTETGPTNLDHRDAFGLAISITAVAEAVPVPLRVVLVPLFGGKFYVKGPGRANRAAFGGLGRFQNGWEAGKTTNGRYWPSSAMVLMAISHGADPTHACAPVPQTDGIGMFYPYQDG